MAVRRAQKHFDTITREHHEGDADLDRYFVEVSEFMFWVFIADEGFKLVLEGHRTPGGRTYEQIQNASKTGQHVIAARWARNKITHCLARPVSESASGLDDFTLDKSRLGPDLRWQRSEDIIKVAIDAERREKGRCEYDEHFAEKPVYPTLLHCFEWISEVRYDYRSSQYAASWFRNQD